MRTLYVGQFIIIPTRVLAHLETSNVVRGRILHPGTPYLGIKLPFLHPPHKQRGIYTYPNQWKTTFVSRSQTYTAARYKEQDVQPHKTISIRQVTGGWIQHQDKLPHKFKNTTIQCHVRTKILKSHQNTCKDDSKFFSYEVC